MRRTLHIAATLASIASATPAAARSILLTNDDGLTSNTVALYKALKAQGHDVIVAIPCTNQSGMGAALQLGKPLAPLAEPCRSQAAPAGAPATGKVTRPGFDATDFYYVYGTPVMALRYGVDIVAAQRWHRAPDLVLSGPNEGQNVGAIVLSSGTVSAAQVAAVEGLPAIALSAGTATADDATLANPASAKVADAAVRLVAALDQRAGTGPMLPAGMALNVNFPDKLDGAGWRVTRIGSYNAYRLRFVESVARAATPAMVAAAAKRGVALPDLPGLSFGPNPTPPEPGQADDEAAAIRQSITVTPMQAGYDKPDGADWVRRNAAELFRR